MRNKRKKALFFIVMLILVCIVGACTTDKMNHDDTVIDDVSDNNLVDQEEKVQVPLLLYYGNTMVDALITEEVMVDNVAADNIIKLLSEHNIVSKDTKVVNFTIEEEDGSKILYLDLSKQFKEYMDLMGKSGEYVIMGALTNTFLKAFEGDSILITVNGATLETLNNLYNTYLTWYPLEEVEEYFIKEESLKTEIIDIKYPQITGMSDRELEASFNTSLMRAALDYEDDCLIFYSLSYEVATSDEKILSIVYRGSVNYDGAAYPMSYILTFNFDMASGKEIRLRDYADCEALKTMFNAGEYTVLTNNVTQEDLKTYFEMANLGTDDIAFEDFDYVVENKTFIAPGFSYRKNHHPVVTIQVNHALGDYVEIEFNQELE